MTSGRIREYLDAGLEAVEEASAIALEYFRRPMDVQNKLEGIAFDPVTEADKRIEACIRERLEARYPGVRIVGEEHGTTGAGDTYWVIDPIDGTRSFISGMPTWGILLGLVDGGRAVAGIMHQPFTGETYLADTTRGAWLRHGGRETPLRARHDARLADAILYSTHPFMLQHAGIEPRFQSLAAKVRLQRWGGDCYAFSLIAAGCIDLMVDGMLQPYDIVALIPIIEGAGGVVTNLKGESPLEGGTVVASANAVLHAEALAILNEA